MLASLQRFAGNQAVLIDSADLDSRPKRYAFCELASVFSDCEPSIEFVATHDPFSGTYWAVIEEEYNWLIFEDP